jgi:hypothetical protein
MGKKVAVRALRAKLGEEMRLKRDSISVWKEITRCSRKRPKIK